MAELKLFISHSSRLDDVDGANDTQENWDLLEALCNEIKAQNFEGVDINILVDQSIGSGKDWENKLNLWLHECHAAIILYSERALKESAWVKKEATILNWRWQVTELEKDKIFPLLPVFFQGETNIEDAKRELSEAVGAQQINSVTCPKDATTIVNEIKQHDGFKQLVDKIRSEDIPTTPFTKIAEDLKIHLIDDQIFNDLKAAWNKLTHVDKPSSTVNSAEDLINNLIRFLLTSPANCMQKLRDFATGVVRKETRDRIQEVHGVLRSIWVNAGAASQLRSIQDSNSILALNGIHLNDSASNGLDTTNHFTVDRYIKRLWHNDITGVLVPITNQITRENIEMEIWKQCRIYNPNSPQDRLRKNVNQKEFIIVYLVAKNSSTDLPDADLASEIIALQQVYPNLRILVGTGEQPLAEDTPGILPITPALNIDVEDDQYLNDCNLQSILCPLPR